MPFHLRIGLRRGEFVCRRVLEQGRLRRAGHRAKAASRELLAALAGGCPADHGFYVNPSESLPGGGAPLDALCAGRRYPWGNTVPSPADTPPRLCWARNPPLSTCSTGSLAGDRSPFGLYDMGGNIFEWTADWDGPYAAGAVSNPRGPTTGTRRMRRGVWARSSGPDVRSSRRYAYLPTAGDFGVGVRCA